MVFKNDQFTSQSLMILQNSATLKNIKPYKQYVFSSKSAHHKLEPQVKLDAYQEQMSNTDEASVNSIDALNKELMDLPTYGVA